MHALPPAIRDHRDVVGAAETGSGKTLAFGIPVVHHILRLKTEQSEEVDKKPWYALILTPTRELALQVKSHMTAITRHAGIKVATVVGGMSELKQERVLRQQPEIIVATPGRLWEMLDKGDPHLSKIGNVRLLVLDEADRMVQQGHFVELVNILQKLPQPKEKYESTSTIKKRQWQERRHKKRKNVAPLTNTEDDTQPTIERQTFVFSATLLLPKVQHKRKPLKHSESESHSFEVLMEKAGLRSHPCVIDLTQKRGTVETLTETRITCAEHEKDMYLYYFLHCHPGRTLIFTNTVNCIRRLRSLLSILQLNPLPMHAGMQQRQRLKNLEKFSKDPNGLLVASDVAARGLDILSIDHVIHYQVPQNADLYVHRSGRTARALTEGISVMLVGPKDTANYKKICRVLNRNEDLKLFPVDMSCWMELKARVSLATRIDREEHKVTHDKSKIDWFVKAAKAMEIDIDEHIHISPDESDKRNSKKTQQKLKDMKYELTSMLKKPLMPSGYSVRFPTASTKLVQIGLHSKFKWIMC
jgi:ATP-dependent RNA helicase DDX24/MAK5